MTMNDTWGYKSYDDNWKSPETLIRHLIDITSKGGNLLLNVGPTSLGEIPAPSIDRLQAMGTWLDRNGEAIYATTASPFRRLDWGRATQKPGKLYLHVFDWPTDGILVVPMSSGAQRASLLTDPDTALKFTASPDGRRIRVPSHAPDAVASVIVLEGVGQVVALPPPPLRQAGATLFKLPVDDAELRGPHLRVQGNTVLNLGEWRGTDDEARWDVEFDRTGTYEIVLLRDVENAAAGAGFVIAVGDAFATGTTAGTAGDYRERTAGTIEVTRLGRTTVSLRPTSVTGGEFMKLREFSLRRID
jgi:alpha-L-fucosidase